jgi:hypothetical protein
MTSIAARAVPALLAIALGSGSSAQLSMRPADPITYRVDAQFMGGRDTYIDVIVTARNTSTKPVLIQVPDCPLTVTIRDKNDTTHSILWSSPRRDRARTVQAGRTCNGGIAEITLLPGDSIHGGPLSFGEQGFRILDGPPSTESYEFEVAIGVPNHPAIVDVRPLSVTSLPFAAARDSMIDSLRRLMRRGLDSSLANVEFRVASGLEDIAPRSFGVHISAFNKSSTVTYMEYGACAMTLFAYRSPERNGNPVWRSDLSAPPFAKSMRHACLAYLATHLLAPGDSFSADEFNGLIPTYEILGDSLAEGTYYFQAKLGVNRKTFSLNAGSALLVRKHLPLPSMRMKYGISYTASAQRTASPQHLNDSIRFEVGIQNTSRVTRSIESNECIPVAGFTSAEMRDSWYMRSAQTYDWLARPCPLHLPQLNLRPGEIVTLRGSAAAPPSRLHYGMWLTVITKGSGSQRQGEDVVLSAEESRLDD